MINTIPNSLKGALSRVPSKFRQLLEQIPPEKKYAHLIDPNWIYFEMIERYLVLQEIGILPGMKILEIGCGAHAITTNVLGFLVGKEGSVVAVDRARWQNFERMVSYTGFHDRIIPLKLDATHLPIPYKTFDLAVIIHGIRNMGEDKEIISVLQELLRVASKVAIAESLPIAHVPSQQAHLEMYNLRAPLFEKIGRIDDYPYRPLKELTKLVQTAGGQQVEALTKNFDLPHFLAKFPRELIKKIQNHTVQEEMRVRWDNANRQLEKEGESFPPVGIVIVNRES